MEAIFVIFALLVDLLMDNQQFYGFLIESFELVYQFIQHKFIKATLRSSIFSTYKVI